jgi:hypothetical protein
MVVNRVLTGLVVVCALAAIAFVWLWREAEDRYVRSEQLRDLTSRRAREVESRVDSLEAHLRRLEEQLPEVPESGTDKFWYEMAQRARANQHVLLHPAEIQLLQLRGLADPVTQLRDDLMNHPELIPYEGTRGGRMLFLRSQITLLSPQWVFARFEDGHIGGQCFLEYRVRPGGVIEWEVVRAHLDA